LTDRNTDFELTAVLAVMVAPFGLITAVVAATNVVALLPAGIVMLGGTVTTGLSVESAIVAPPTGAGVTSPTRPRIDCPPRTADESVVNVRMPGIAGTS
jgi:hypothetical protein